MFPRDKAIHLFNTTSQFCDSYGFDSRILVKDLCVLFINETIESLKAVGAGVEVVWWEKVKEEVIKLSKTKTMNTTTQHCPVCGKDTSQFDNTAFMVCTICQSQLSLKDGSVIGNSSCGIATPQEKSTHYHVADNSDAFRDWLKGKGIDFINNEHFTSIPLEGNDIFQLGVAFGLYRQSAMAQLDKRAVKTREV